MSNTDLIIEERSRDIGDFLVGRLLPFRKKRMVGPFIFIDHMGPTELGPGHYMDVDQHPHIGLSTLTYLLEGEIRHKDSIGSDQVITPGSVNLMVAGSGVTHTERTPDELRGKSFTAHGYQIWIALPKSHEHITPEFHHIGREELPNWQDDDADFTLIAGSGYGRTSPVPALSPQFMVEVRATKDYVLDIEHNLQGEIGLVIVDGSIDACGQTIEKGNMLVSKTENACKVVVKSGTHLLLFGGESFEEERFIYWNFVATSKERIEQAKQDWVEKKFPKVDGDNSYVPLPGS